MPAFMGIFGITDSRGVGRRCRDYSGVFKEIIINHEIYADITGKEVVDYYPTIE